jgi:transposase
MRDKELYATILGIAEPWRVADVELSAEQREVRVSIEHSGSPLTCPKCGRECSRYDTRRREWRHLDTCQYRTVLVAEVPRINCEHDGVLQTRVPWAEPGSRFTALFEALAIDWLKEASIAAVARRVGASWSELDGIMQRAVRRGLARRKSDSVTAIGVDETSFQKRHEYVTVVSDLEKQRVLHIGDSRGTAPLAAYFERIGPEGCAALRVVAMDMWRAYIKATRDHVPGADEKIVFDRFHVARQINEGVNHVRKQEHRALRRDGDDRLMRTKFLWLMGPEQRERLGDERRDQFEELRDSALKVARAWAMKEAARGLWSYAKRGWAERAWRKWIGWAMRSRLEPMKRAAQMVRDHLWGILNAVVLKATNASSESLNAKIQKVKALACGFRNRERFRNAIYFHCGQLDLYPQI